jgi:hypothetical protein
MATILSSPNDSLQESLRNREPPAISRTKATSSPDRFALKRQVILGFSRPRDYSVARVTLWFDVVEECGFSFSGAFEASPLHGLE